jgi:hypothetical protein
MVLSCPAQSLNQQTCHYLQFSNSDTQRKWFDFHKHFLYDSYGSGYLIGLLYIRQDDEKSVNFMGM